MSDFYLRISIYTLTMALFSVIAIYIGVRSSDIDIGLLPNASAELQWFESVSTNAVSKEGTSANIISSAETVEYNFLLSAEKEFPYAAYNMNFNPPDDIYKTVDLSKYYQLTFDVACEPNNVLALVIHTHDNDVTDMTDESSRRVSSMLFACDENFRRVTVPFSSLFTPDWWLSRFGRDFLDRKFLKSKVYGFAISNSLDSPRDSISVVKLKNITLIGSNYNYVYSVAAVLVLIWLALLAWIFRLYIRVLVEKVKAKVLLDRPFIAYKQLSMAPQKDKEKSAVLKYLATEYANPDLNLEVAIDFLGVNRAKINNILKEELGLTFATYINKLRLTEAARLLSEEDANVAEIAYSVGYNNVSYFNKLFKSEYSCTPKAFKSMYQNKE